MAEIKVSAMTFLASVPDDAKIYIVKNGDTSPYYTTKAALLGMLDLQNITNNGAETTNPISFTDDLGGSAIVGPGLVQVSDDLSDQRMLVTPLLIGVNGIADSAKEIKFLFDVPTGSTIIRVANEFGNPTMATREWTNSQINTAVVGLFDDRGSWNASDNIFPNIGGSGDSGAILRGDLWTISVAGILGGVAVTAGDVVRALVDSPGQTASNWSVTENNLGYVPENTSNKSNDVADASSSTKFPVWSAIVSYFSASRIRTILGISTLSGSNTGDETATSIRTKVGDASSSNSGVSKLYTSTGSNTDGSVTQKLFTASLSNIAETTTDGTVSSGTANTVSSAILIEAPKVVAGNVIDVVGMVRATGTAGTRAARLYVNTTPDLSGTPILIGAYTGVSNTALDFSIQRFLRVKVTNGTGAGTEVMATSNNVASNYAFSTTAVTTCAIDWTVNQYIVIAVQATNSGDSLRSTLLKARR